MFLAFPEKSLWHSLDQQLSQILGFIFQKIAIVSSNNIRIRKQMPIGKDDFSMFILFCFQECKFNVGSYIHDATQIFFTGTYGHPVVATPHLLDLVLEPVIQRTLLMDFEVLE